MKENGAVNRKGKQCYNLFFTFKVRVLIFMETLKQAVHIPISHQLHFDVTLPQDFPIGSAEVLLIFAFQSEASKSPNLSELFKLGGSLRNSELFKNGLEIQRKWRDEWQ
jgi:hypothetical protein